MWEIFDFLLGPSLRKLIFNWMACAPPAYICCKWRRVIAGTLREKLFDETICKFIMKFGLYSVGLLFHFVFPGYFLRCKVTALQRYIYIYIHLYMQTFLQGFSSPYSLPNNWFRQVVCTGVRFNVWQSWAIGNNACCVDLDRGFWCFWIISGLGKISGQWGRFDPHSRLACWYGVSLQSLRKVSSHWVSPNPTD